MIAWIIRWSVENRFLVLCAALLLAGWGFHSAGRVPVDALPDLSENHVIVHAEWDGRNPAVIEAQVTQPLSAGLQGIAGVRRVRASSMFGFALVTVVFADDVDRAAARARVLERLNTVAASLPPEVSPRLGPEANGLGWVFQYYLEDNSGGQDLGSLRALQDNFIRPQLAALPGVAEVAGIGGFVREWQVEVSSLRLAHHGIAVSEVLEAIRRNNLDAGGRTLEDNGLELLVHGRGLVSEAADLEAIPLATRHGGTILLRELATVRLGGGFRRGALDVDGREVVGGTVVMQAGANARQVIAEVKDALARLSPGLPAGVAVRPFYDRSGLIDRALSTLRAALWESVLMVTLVHVLFLFHFRSILIVTLPLPASILIAFILMKELGIQSHIMSLTGIAIAVGVLVDAGIVMVENVIRRCAAAEIRLGRPLSSTQTRENVLAASRQIGRPAFFSMAIIILAFVPVFALGGQEGKLFHPLAWTKTFAMVGATLLAVTLVPALCTWLVRGPFQPEERNPVMRLLLRAYAPALDWALAHRGAVLGLAAALLAFGLLLAVGIPARLSPAGARLFPGLGSEFMPALEEDALLFMPVLPPGTSLTEVKRIMAWQDKVIRATPEVAGVAGKLGRFDSATDPAPVEMIETTVTLKPAADWRPGLTREALVAELTARLRQVPGYVPGFLQPVENRVLMLSTGIRAQLGVKIFGDDPAALQAKAREIAGVIEGVPGAVGVVASRLQHRPYLEIVPDRTALALYGLSVAEVFDVVETGLGGRVAGHAIHGRERRAILVRFEQADREDPDRLATLPVPVRASPPTMAAGTATPMPDMLSSLSPPPPGRMTGMRLPPATVPAPADARPAPAVVPLGRIATIRRVSGPAEIVSEDGRLYAFVQANVAGRDLGGFVAQVREKVAAVPLAPGMTLAYSGQYEHQARAAETLRFIVPVVLVVIFVLLALVFRSPAEAAHVLLAVPFALTGGFLLQWLLGYPFSVAAWVGYIALFGTAIQTGIVMMVYLEEAVARRRQACGAAFTRSDLLAAVKDGARLRLRPKVMTVATTVAGLVPVFWSSSTGAEVMRPIAAPVVGGMLSSLWHILIVTPVIFAWLGEKRLSAAQRDALPATGTTATPHGPVPAGSRATSFPASVSTTDTSLDGPLAE